MDNNREQALLERIQVIAFDHADEIAKYNSLLSDQLLPLLSDALDAHEIGAHNVIDKRLRYAIKLIKKHILL